AVPTIIGEQDPVKSAEVLVQQAEALAKKLAREGLKMAQVRDVFDELRQIESLWTRNPQSALRRLLLLRPKLRYRTARVKELQSLAEVLEHAVEEVMRAETNEVKRERFRRLMEFAEAVVAYHKAYGGE
ncbi:MAG: type III-A CRISPR-associated protein Csm2, partial [Candidatus Bipolaricaulaceae bacterium]